MTNQERESTLDGMNIYSAEAWSTPRLSTPTERMIDGLFGSGSSTPSRPDTNPALAFGALGLGLVAIASVAYFVMGGLRG